MDVTKLIREQDGIIYKISYSGKIGGFANTGAQGSASERLDTAIWGEHCEERSRAKARKRSREWGLSTNTPLQTLMLALLGVIGGMCAIERLPAEAGTETFHLVQNTFNGER